MTHILPAQPFIFQSFPDITFLITAWSIHGLKSFFFLQSMFKMEYIILHPIQSYMLKTAKIFNLGSNQTSNEHIASYLIMKLHNEVIE